MLNKNVFIEINKELLFSAIVILPYIERGYIAKEFSLVFTDGYVKAVVAIMLVVSLLLATASIMRKGTSIIFTRAGGCLFTLLLYLVARMALQTPFETKCLTTLLWIITPIAYALLLVNTFRKYDMKRDKLLNGIFFWMSAYSLFAVAYNIIVFGLFRDTTVRMTASGGGPVIFGYTLAFMYTLLIANKDSFTKIEFYAYSAIFFISAMSTGSRGAIWPMLALFAYDWLKKKASLLKIVEIGAGASLLLALVGRIARMFPHLFSTANSYRNITLSNSVSLYHTFTINQKLFGIGIGKVFPYQKWLLDVSDHILQNVQNLTTIMGRTMLVQPHNSFIYLGLEAGAVAVLLVLLFNVFCIKDRISNRSKGDSILRVSLPCFTFCFVNFFDSILCVAPGVAATFWSLMLIHSNCNDSGQR